MIRFLFRLLASAFLAVAVVMAVMDATRSVAISVFDPTPLGALWFRHAPAMLDGLQQWLNAKMPVLWDPVMLSVLKVPGFVVFAVLAFIFYAIGHRRDRKPRFAAGH